MQVAVFEVTEWEHEACLRLQPEHVVTCFNAPLGHGDAADHADAEVVSTFIRSDLSERVLRQLPKLRLIATRSTDFDHIDLDYCRRAGSPRPSHGTKRPRLQRSRREDELLGPPTLQRPGGWAAKTARAEPDGRLTLNVRR